MLNPKNYKPNRCTGSGNYSQLEGRTKTTGICGTCETPQQLTKTGLVKAHDK